MSRKRLLLGIAPFMMTGLVWLFRYDLSFGPYYSIYDMTLTDTLEASHAGTLRFGTHDFMAGGFKGNAVNIGVSAPIPDSAIQKYVEPIRLDPKYIQVDEYGHEVYDGPPIPDPPSRYVRIPVLPRLPPRMPWQKYHFHFTYFPHDSVQLRIQVLDKDDCSHIDRLAKTAFLRAGPCSY